jgi:hypothetical protein
LYSGDIAVKDENGYILIVDLHADERPASSSKPTDQSLCEERAAARQREKANPRAPTL